MKQQHSLLLVSGLFIIGHSKEPNVEPLHLLSIKFRLSTGYIAPVKYKQASPFKLFNTIKIAITTTKNEINI